MQKEKIPFEYIQKVCREEVKKCVLFDDRVFRIVCENKAFVERVIQIFLRDDKIKVLKVEPQKDIKFYCKRGVRLDVLCRLVDGTLVNVEIEKNKNHNKQDHQKRVRVISSSITMQYFEEGESYNDVPNVCVIYLTEKDFLKQKLPVYHVVRKIDENNTTLYNGFTEIYANAEYEDDSKESKLMKYLVCNNPVEEEQKKNEINIEDAREDRKMSPEFEKLMKDLREEGREEGMVTAFVKMVKNGLITISDAAKNLGITEREFKALMPA